MLKSIATALVSIVVSGTTLLYAKPIMLLTTEEASRKEEKSKAVLISPPPPAPQIAVEEPDNPIAKKPFAIKIRFSSSNNATVKLSSVKVQVVKVIPISLNKVLDKYISANGIDVPEADIPRGNYTVRIYLQDTRGRIGQAESQWVVK